MRVFGALRCPGAAALAFFVPMDRYALSRIDGGRHRTLRGYFPYPVPSESMVSAQDDVRAGSAIPETGAATPVRPA